MITALMVIPSLICLLLIKNKINFNKIFLIITEDNLL